MDSSWSMLDSDSPSPPPLPPPLGSDINSINHSHTTQAIPATSAASLTPNITDNQTNIPASLPPPLFGQYPPYQPVGINPLSSNIPLTTGQTLSGGIPLQNGNNQSSSLTTFSPYSSSFLRRRQAYDARNNGVISKIAEEKTRSAFRSIEVILDTFSSLSSILENTYSAIYGSFRTLTNVADNIIFLQNHLAELALLPRAIQILSKFFKWILEALGLGQTKFVQQLDDRLKTKIWNQAIGVPSDEEHDKLLQDIHDSSSGSAWPILAFISLIFGTPYLVKKLFSVPPEIIPKTNRPEWTTRHGRHYIAVGLYDFTARNSNELSFKKDAQLFLQPDSVQPGSRWFIATLAVDDPNLDPRKLKPIGLVPSNYVRILMK